MNLKNGTIVSDGDKNYTVLATLWNTVYLVSADGSRAKSKLTLCEIRKYYKNIVFN